MTFPTVHRFATHLFWFPYRPFVSCVLQLLPKPPFTAAHPPLRQVKVISAEQRGKPQRGRYRATLDYAVLSHTPLVSTQLRCSWERMCPFLTPQWLHADTERPLGGRQWCSFHSNCHCSTCDNMISHLRIPFFLLLLRLLVAVLVAGGFRRRRSRITELLLRKLASSRSEALWFLPLLTSSWLLSQSLYIY